MAKYAHFRLCLIAVLAIALASSCSGGKTFGTGATGEEIEGTEGLDLSFLPNSPPEVIKVSKEDATFGVTMQARNAGTYAINNKEIEGFIFLSGYDANIIKFPDGNSKDMKEKYLEKASVSNPNGGTDLFEFEGNVEADQLLADTYSFNLLATSCYRYETKASPSVCIDPSPYKEVEKACAVENIALSSQGAPIAVTSVEEEVLSEKIQFRITISNVGGGRAISTKNPEDCNPFKNRIDLRQNIDIVYLDEPPKIGGKDGTPLKECRPKNSDNSIRLIEGEGFILCSLEKTNDIKSLKQGYTTPLFIQLRYTYMQSIQQPIKVLKVE